MLAASAVALWPAIAQRAPESILPPGFGQPDPPANQTAPAPSAPPASDDLVPDLALRPPTSDVTRGDVIGEVIGNLSDNALVAVEAPDLPPEARRSLDRVGLLAPEDGGFADSGFGASDGRFLATLMQRIDAPLASRWMQIVLRRALLSPTAIPPNANGADWVAERAWLLLRMGESDTARALIARVDAENFTPRLSEIAMQAALATGDPASVCPVADQAALSSDEVSWPLAQAMCAGLSGEPGTASALIDKVRDDGDARGIDVLLAEKVIGAATNSRRAVMIQWEGVDKLDAWRFGLASATGVTIPPALFDTVGPQVEAWAARAPLIAPTARASAAERAAAMGVFSSQALTDFYASLWDATDPAERGATVGESLRVAYGGAPDARLSALRNLWEGKDSDAYARLILTARAAELAPVVGGVAASDSDRLITSMLSAGLDIQAARWASQVDRASVGWAALAVGAPRALSGSDSSAVRSVPAGEDDRRAKFLLAGLAGLGRLPASEASALAESYKVPLGRQDSWTRALDRAAAAGEPATVVLLSAAGMQTRAWRYVPPQALYHIVAALRRVGLEPEARMIAAEAIARA